MGKTGLVLDFIQGLEAKDSADAVGSSFQKLIGEFGFTYFCVGAIKPGRAERGMVWATSMRHGWFQHWVKNQYISNDPVIRQLKQDPRPLRWSALRARKDVARLDILDEAGEFGIRDGWSLAFEFGGTDVPAIALGLGAKTYELRAEDEVSLRLAGVYSSLKFAQFARRLPVVRGPLSERERECLNLVAAGKTDWEISEILSISHQTAHKHVSNALRKLNARTRAHAVAIALMSKLISV